MNHPAKDSSVKVHFFYVTLILVLCMIGLITHKWTGISEFREYLNVGATVTSLVLGILAIIYSFVSSGQQSSVLGAVEAAASTTSSSVAKLDNFMKSAETLQNEAATRTAGLHSLTTQLASSVNDIKEETNSLALATLEIVGKINTLPHQLGELRGILEKSDKTTNTPRLEKKPADHIWSLKDIESALRLASTFGLTVLHSLILSKEYGKDFSLKKLSEAMGDKDSNYAFGFMIGFMCTGLIFAQKTDGLGVYTVSSIHADFVQAVNAEWKRRELAAGDPETKARLVTHQAHALLGLTDKPLPPSEEST